MVQRQILSTTVLVLSLSPAAMGQLNQNCTVSVLNRTVQVNPDGSWVLPNIPANFGQVKARATCIQNGQTIFGESAFFSVPANGAVNLPVITLGNTTQVPIALQLTSTATFLSAVGQTSQLSVAATYPDNSTKNVTAGSTGTNYTTSNAKIASITSDGLVTAVASGTVVIQATNDGASGILTLQVVLGGTSHGGIPDSWITANGLNVNDPTLAAEDPDHDGLTNLQEFQLGTNPNNPDTDGDGLNDGDEVNKYHTSPLLPDTDGDRIPDGVEVQTGTNPLDPASYDLKRATATSTVSPPSFTLSTSVANPVLSVQLNWKVTLIDGKTTLDLTADPRTSYASSNLNICNFGGQPGLVFSSSTGSCTITISQNTLKATVPGTITSFTPGEVSTLSVPGAVAVDVAGSFAYVAAGTNGLAVVDITDRSKPRVRATLGGIGNAVAVKASGQAAFVADSSGFLRIISALNPDAPALISSVTLAGTPSALAVHGALAAVATQSGGVSLVNIGNPITAALIGDLTIPGSAIGVDFDLQSGVAAVAMGTAGLQLADFSNPALPKLRGLLPGGDARRVLLRMPAALLADAQRSVTAVNVSNPDNPALSTSLAPNIGGVPVDIAAYGNIAMTADISFGRAIPMVNISAPLLPTSVGYWTLLSPGFSSSIAVDISFGYVIIPASSTLRILQYQNITDPFGVPPTISITSPVSGTPLIQGQTLTVAANATDDVAVASVSLSVNGQVLTTEFSPPYQVNYTVPLAATSLTFGATAVDYGNLTGTAQNLVVPVIPDPDTTAQGRVLDWAGNLVPGATVSAFGKSTVTAIDGTFSLPGLPTVQGPIVILATATVSGTVLAGSSTAISPVPGGITNMGTIRIVPAPVITFLSRKSALAGGQVTLQVNGSTLTGSAFAFQPAVSPPIAVQVNSISSDGTSASLALTIPATAVGTFAVVATNLAGRTDSTVTKVNRFTVVDPNSTADTDRDGVQDVIEAVFGTDPLDPASFPVIPTLTETEGVAFSVLNAPVTGAGIIETESVAFSLLNAPVTGAGITETEGKAFSLLNAPITGSGTTETESVAFSLLNAPITGAGIVETESVAFSLLNAPAGSSGISEVESYFSVLNSSTSQSQSTQIQLSKTAEPLTTGDVDTSHPSPIDPFLDSDGDGLPDWYETLIGTDPSRSDTDGDGLTDYEELFRYRTNPLNPDTDGDGFPDGVEIVFGSDPLDPNSTPVSLAPRTSASKLDYNGIPTIAASGPSKKNLVMKGDTHVKPHSTRSDPRKSTTSGGVSRSFIPQRTDP